MRYMTFLLALTAALLLPLIATGESRVSDGQDWATENAYEESNYYIPGMPVPKVDQPGQPTDGQPTKKGERISKISKAGDSRQEIIDRSKLLAHDIYTGIIPGVRDSLPHLERHQERGRKAKKPNQLVWLGYQPFAQGSRVFLQTSVKPAYTVVTMEDGMTVVIELMNTKIPLYNNQRNIDTSFFPKAVTSIDAAVLSKKRVQITITLRERVPFHVSSQNEYLFIDFEDTSQ